MFLRLTQVQIDAQINWPKALILSQMESCLMRDRLQVSFWGLHLTADGVVAIAVALLIIITVVVASKL